MWSETHLIKIQQCYKCKGKASPGTCEEISVTANQSSCSFISCRYSNVLALTPEDDFTGPPGRKQTGFNSLLWVNKHT